MGEQHTPHVEAVENETEVRHNGAPDRYLMWSGGMDSTAMVHVMHEEVWDDWHAWNKRPVVIFLETTIGLSAQRIYAQLAADYFGWQLWSLRTHENFDDHSEKEGLYGPDKHDNIFNVLKGRQIGKLATTSGNPHIYFGSRVEEKGEHVTRKVWREDHGAYTHNPIYDWSDEEVAEYLYENEIPFNPHWKAAHPTDCACGATAAREELIELEAEGYEVFAQKLRELEERVKTGDRREWWGWGGWDPTERMQKDAEANPEQTQLSDIVCGPNCSGKSKLADLEVNDAD
jgi:3'-phosphoadenosine 5'-phosphosulfate sulfotransferase (PAPS reductase)/FAD synthetase